MNLVFMFGFIFLAGPVGSSTRVTDETVVTMVPGSKIDIKNWRDYVLKTHAGTKVKIEFDYLGEMKEASGANLNRGDIFEPGQGLISLSSAAHNLKKIGKTLKGDWVLEHDQKLGWIYEIQGELDGGPVDYAIDAKTGMIKILQGPQALKNFSN
jgi:hypothetical protein